MATEGFGFAVSGKGVFALSIQVKYLDYIKGLAGFVFKLKSSPA